MHPELVQWSPDFSVGIPEIDDQHRGLLALVNRVYAAVINHANSAEVEEIVHALEHYTVQHFADEERYMVHARYPKYGMHKAVHDQFIERVAAEKDRLLAGFPLDIDIVHFLRDWLINHILRMDKEFGLYEQGLQADVKTERAGFFKRLFRPDEASEAGFGSRLRKWFGRGRAAAAPAEDAPKTVFATGPATVAPVPAVPAAAGGDYLISGLDFQGAIEVHMRWKARFKAVIEGSSDEKLDPEIVRADDRCALGMWLYGEGKARFDARPEYLDVLMWHAEFHRQAGIILETSLKGERETAVQELERGSYMLAAIKLRGCLARLFVAAGNP